jgi:hypothetical protein
MEHFEYLYDLFFACIVLDNRVEKMKYFHISPGTCWFCPLRSVSEIDSNHFDIHAFWIIHWNVSLVPSSLVIISRDKQSLEEESSKLRTTNEFTHSWKICTQQIQSLWRRFMLIDRLNYAWIVLTNWFIKG